MCGIVFAKSLDGKPVNRLVIEQFQNQRERGTRGFGIARQEVGENGEPTMVLDRSVDELKFQIDLQLKLNPSDMILAHHRMPTSTPNLTHQTHPIKVTHPHLQYDYLIVHNGVISNPELRATAHNKLFQDLTDKYLLENVVDIQDPTERMKRLSCHKLFPMEYFDEHDNFLLDKAIKDEKAVWDFENQGYVYQTLMTDDKFNDSEALAVDLALYLEKVIDKVEARGSAAYVGLVLDKATQKPLKLFFGRNNSNPLHYARNQKTIRIASLGVGKEVEANTITVIDLLHPDLKQKTHKLEIESWGNYNYNTKNRNQNYITEGNGAKDKENDKEDSKSDSTDPSSEVGFRAQEDRSSLPVHTSGKTDAELHYEDTSDNDPSGAGDEDDEFADDPEISKLVTEAEYELEDQLSNFIDAIAEDVDLPSAEAMIDAMAENMRDWLDKIAAARDNIDFESYNRTDVPDQLETDINTLVPSNNRQTSPKE